MTATLIHSDRINSKGQAGRERQLTLSGFPPHREANWQELRTKRLPLDESRYRAIVECYGEVYASYLPGPNTPPFFTQISRRLAELDVQVQPTTIASLVRRARRLGIADFPDPLKRTVNAASQEARKLRAPGSPFRMSAEQHNTFARIYRELQKEGYPKKKKGKGFYDEAQIRMKAASYSLTSKQLGIYASYRRRIGDVNFPRLRGSHELDRMHLATVDRLQALGVMATGLMHEILQPLQIILGEAELQKDEARRERRDIPKLDVRMDTIVNQVKKLSEVVQHVRTIARAGEPKIEPVGLTKAVNDALLLFMNQLRGKGIEIELSIPADLPEISADAIGVERIFINLITNARDAIEETSKGEGKISVSAHATDECVVCEVSDTGTGIIEENRSKIFDPYFTTKEIGKGTGMGLAEVMNLMIQFDGRVTVESTPWQHTTFTLEFPKHVREP